MHLAYLLVFFSFRLTLNILCKQQLRVHNTDELKQRFLHVWHGTDQTIIDNAIDEWCGHLRACVEAKSKHFEQLL